VGPRAKTAIGIAVAAALLVVGGFFARRASRGRLHAIDAIPGNAFLVVTLDVEGLRRSPLGAPIFGGVTSKLAGEKALTDLCGFDPLTRMREIAVAVPEDGERGDFGISIRADVSGEELLQCAKKVIEARQAKAASAPTIRQSGSYILVEPDSPDDDPLRRYPTLAYRDGGPFLIGRGLWLASMIDTAEGKLPSAAANADHASLRKELEGPSGLDKPTLLATAILPKSLRERLKTELGSELGLDDQAEAHAAARGATVMAGVLGVGSVGVGIQAGPTGGDSAVTAVFRCEEKTACAEVERLIARRRLDWSQQISLRLLGVGPLLDSMKIDNQQTLLRVSSHAPTDDAARWLDRVLTLRSPRHTTAGPLTSATPRPAPSPDEVLKPPNRRP
jgi:hypothetical protein